MSTDSFLIMYFSSEVSSLKKLNKYNLFYNSLHFETSQLPFRCIPAVSLYVQ